MDWHQPVAFVTGNTAGRRLFADAPKALPELCFDYRLLELESLELELSESLLGSLIERSLEELSPERPELPDVLPLMPLSRLELSSPDVEDEPPCLLPKPLCSSRSMLDESLDEPLRPELPMLSAI